NPIASTVQPPARRPILKGLPILVPRVAVADLRRVDDPNELVVARGRRDLDVSAQRVLQRQQLGLREAVLQGEDRDILAVTREGAEVLCESLVPRPQIHQDTCSLPEPHNCTLCVGCRQVKRASAPPHRVRRGMRRDSLRERGVLSDVPELTHHHPSGSSGERSEYMGCWGAALWRGTRAPWVTGRTVVCRSTSSRTSSEIIRFRNHRSRHHAPIAAVAATPSLTGTMYSGRLAAPMR